MAFDVQRISLWDRVAGGAGAVLLLCQFLPFYTVSVAGFSDSLSGRSAGFLAFVGLLLGVLAGVAAVLPAGGREWPAQSPVSRRVAVLGLSALAALFLLARFVATPNDLEAAQSIGFGVDAGRGFGLFLAVVAVLAQVAVAAIAFKDSGEKLPDRSSFGKPGETPPPPPPPAV